MVATTAGPSPTIYARAALLLLAALAPAACRSVPPAEPPAGDGRVKGGVEAEAGEAEVRAAVEGCYGALSARDWDAFADCFWPGAVLVSVYRPEGEDAERVFSVTVPEFVERAPEGPGSREIFEERMLSAEIWRRGGLAQVRSRFAARFGDPGDVMEWTGTDAFTLLHHDGRWRITSVTFEADGP